MDVRTDKISLCSSISDCLPYTFRDHRKLLVGDFRGRIYSWSVTDAAGMEMIPESLSLFLGAFLLHSACNDMESEY